MKTSSTGINIRVLFFAKARELSGKNEAFYQLKTENIVASELLGKICKDFNLEVIQSQLILAVNESYCDNLQVELHLSEGDEIAVIPPLSGG